MGRTLGIVAVLFLALLGAIVVVIDLVRIPQMYAVRGEATITYRPDAARISASVFTLTPNPNDGANEVADKMRSLQEALRANGVAPESVVGTSLKQWPVATDPKGDSAPEPRGYGTEQAIVVTVQDLSRLATIVGVVSESGANEWSVEFYSTKTVELEDQVRKAALANATARAEMYAAEGQFKRGKLLKLVDSSVEFPETDYDNRDFENFGDTTEKIVVTGSRLKAPKFMIPEPQPLDVTAEIDVLFAVE